MGKLMFVEPVFVNKMIDKAIKNGEPAKVLIGYELDEELLVDVMGEDESWMFMTDKWNEARSDSMIEDIELAMGNVPIVEGDSESSDGSSGAEDSSSNEKN